MATAETTQPQGLQGARRRVWEGLGRPLGRREEALVGVTGRLRVVGLGWMTSLLGVGWGLGDCAENRGVGEQRNLRTVCTRRHTRTLRTPVWGGAASIHPRTLLPHCLGWHQGLTP